MFRHMIAGAMSVLVLAGCAVPALDPGFIVRTDLATTDCAGKAVLPVDATPGGSDPYNFLNLREALAAPPSGQPDERLRVQDCLHPHTDVLRAAGLRLQRGDVLHLGTGTVGPAYQNDGLPNRLHVPPTLAASVQLTLRTVDVKNGRLYAEEDQFLAAAFSMAGRSDTQRLSPGLAAALDRQQILLWNTLVDNLRVWRRPVPEQAPERPVTGRPALSLLVDQARWCDAVSKHLAGDATAADRRELTAYFSGTADACPGDANLTSNVEFSRITNVARSALQAIAVAPKPSGGYFVSSPQMALYTQVTVDLKGARMGTGSVSSSGAWTLADWQAAQICRASDGRDLRIVGFRLNDGKRVDVSVNNVHAPTLAIRLAFTQTEQSRRFQGLGHWSERWRRFIDRADLDKLYVRDIREIIWDGEPTTPSMCRL
jgi:hypothetical protein